MSGLGLTVGFAGLTHLGIVSSAAAAAKGAQTVAFDPDVALVARLAKGERPIHEPGLDELVSANADRLAYTADIRDLGRCDLIYVCPDVPTDDVVLGDVRLVEKSLREIFDLAKLSVRVRDAKSGTALPARVTFVAVDGTLPPLFFAESNATA